MHLGPRRELRWHADIIIVGESAWGGANWGSERQTGLLWCPRLRTQGGAASPHVARCGCGFVWDAMALHANEPMLRDALLGQATRRTHDIASWQAWNTGDGDREVHCRCRQRGGLRMQAYVHTSDAGICAHIGCRNMCTHRDAGICAHIGLACAMPCKETPVHAYIYPPLVAATSPRGHVTPYD